MIPPADLASLSFFDGLRPEVVEALARNAETKTFGRGRILWRAGDQPRGLFVVLEGEVRVVRGRAGRQTVIHTETRGGTLGDVPLWAGGTYPATAMATAPTRCAVLSRERLIAAMTAHPSLAPALLERLASRVRGLVGRLERLALLDVRSRVASHLLQRTDRSTPPIASVGLSQAALAEELGTVREVVARALRQLIREKILEPLGGGRYRILDAERL